MWDLKADDFTTSNSGGAATTQTLLAAAGQLPFVLADPTLSGSQAVLYPPSATDGTFAGNPVQALLMTSADGQTNSLLCYGRALALGIIAATDSNGNSTNKHIAVVVGSGLVGSMTSCPVLSSAPAPFVSLLAVVDLTGAYAQGATVACDPKATTGSPNCPKAIGFLQLPTGGTDVKLNGNVALVATGTNVLLVNLEDPTHPSAAGQITGNFGNWLGLTDTGFLLGTSPSSSSGSVQTAALGTIAIIRYVTPHVSVDANSKTTSPIEVDYEFQGNTQNLARGVVDIEQDGKIVGAIPLQDVSPGRHTITIPVGTVLIPAPGTVEAAIVKADGTMTTSIVTSLGVPPSDQIPGSKPVASPSPTLPPGGTSLSPATFAGIGPLSLAELDPDHVTLAQGDTPIQIFASQFDILGFIFVRRLDGGWDKFSANSQSPDETTFVLPASLSSSAGYLEISLSGDDNDTTIPLPVADPSLPTLATAPELTPTSISVDSTDSQGNPLIAVTNASYAAGMRIILVQNQTPIYALPTTFSPTGSLVSPQPSRLANFVGPFTFVAVLSADGKRLSSSLPLLLMRQPPPDNRTHLDVSYPVNAAAAFLLGDVEITGGGRNPGSQGIPSAPLGQLELQGVGLSAGQVVQFKALRGANIVTATAYLKSVQDLTPTEFAGTTDPADPDAKPRLMSGLADLPDSITSLTGPGVSVIGFEPGGKLIATSAKSRPKVEPLRVPFGGRVVASLYKDKNGKYFVLTPSEAGYPEFSELTLVTDQVSLSVALDPSDTRQTPLAQIEIETTPPDPAGYFRVRGLGLNQDPVLSTPARPTSKIIANGVPVRDVSVYYANFGTRDWDHDREIAHWADIHNLPPQYLKAQAVQESAHFSQNFRYEPSTIDFLTLSGDTNPSRASGAWPNILRRPYCFYAVPGTYLLATSSRVAGPPNPDPSIQEKGRIENRFSCTTNQCTQNHFQLYIPGAPSNGTTQQLPVKKMNGPFVFRGANASQIWRVGQETLRTELNAAVEAYLVVGTSAPERLTLVRNASLWRKVSTSGGTLTLAAAPDGIVQTPSNPVAGPGSSATANAPAVSPEFAIDYQQGMVTLGRPLNNGETLIVDFWSARAQGPTEPITAGTDCDAPALGPGNGMVSHFISGVTSAAPELNASNPNIKPQLHLKFPTPPGSNQDLYTFFSNNIQTSVQQHLQNPKHNRGGFLSGTDSDRQLEFVLDGNSQPSNPLDPKFRSATMQPYAGSSYGAMQLTTGAWIDGTKGRTLQGILNLLDPADNSPQHSFQSVFALVDPTNGLNTSLDVGGAFSQISFARLQSNQRCGGLTCTQTKWQLQWSNAFLSYNPSGAPFYSLSPSLGGLNPLVSAGDHCFQPDTFSPQDKNKTLGDTGVDNPCYGNQFDRKP